MFANARVTGVIVACVLCVSSLVSAQAPPTTAGLETGIGQVRAGDFFAAIVTLNAVVTQSSTRPEDAPIAGRAHAFRAQAYLGLEQLERARAAVLLALKSDPNVATNGLSTAVVALFDEVRPSGAPSAEATGDTADRVGNFQLAFDSYLKAYHDLPEPRDPAVDQRLRERIIKLVPKLPAAPAIPPQARDHAARAQDLLDAEAILGGGPGAGSEQAVAELRRAIRLAPWSGEITFRFATLLQRLQRGDEALANLNLYRLADPQGYAARAARASPRDTATDPSAPAAATPVGPALIYIYWPEQQRGGKWQTVQCNGVKVAKLQNNRYVVLKAAVGSHSLKFRNHQIAADVEAGREYHYRASLEGHFQFAQGPELRLISTEAAQTEMRAQGMKVNDARNTFAAECAAVTTRPTPGRRR